MNTISDVSFAENTSQRLPCVILLDGSSSMATGNAIDALNDGLKILAQDLKDDNTARQRVRLMVLRIGDPDDVQVVTDWVDAIDFDPPVIQADGLTPLGLGARRALMEIEQQKRQFDDNGIPFNRPWLFIMTDGEPTDSDWQTAASECRAAEAAGKVTVFCIGVGNANFQQLSQFSAREPRRLDGAKFREFFLWLSRSAKVGSQKATSEPIQMAATDTWAVVPGNT